MVVDKKAQISQIGAEVYGVVEWGMGEDKVVEERGILVDEVKGQVDAEEEEVAAPVLIHWHVIGVGFVAIWPLTVPPPVTSQW